MCIYGRKFKLKRNKKDAYKNGIFQLGKFNGLLLLVLFRLNVLAFIVATFLFLRRLVVGAGFIHSLHRTSIYVATFFHIVVATFTIYKERNVPQLILAKMLVDHKTGGAKKHKRRKDDI